MLQREFTTDENGDIITKISVDDMTIKERQLFKLAHSLNRMRNLLLALTALIILLISDCINQYVYLNSIIKDESKLGRFARPSIAQVIVLYLGIWTFVQSILLIYTWIPSKTFKLQQEERRKSKTKTQNGLVPSTTKTPTIDESSNTIPV